MLLRITLGLVFLLVALGFYLQQESQAPTAGQAYVLLAIPPVIGPDGQPAHLLGFSDCNGQPDQASQLWFARPMPALHADCILLPPGRSRIPVMLVSGHRPAEKLSLTSRVEVAGTYALFWPNGDPVVLDWNKRHTQPRMHPIQPGPDAKESQPRR